MIQGILRAASPRQYPVTQNSELNVQNILTIEEWQDGRAPAAEFNSRLLDAGIGTEGSERAIESQ